MRSLTCAIAATSWLICSWERPLLERRRNASTASWSRATSGVRGTTSPSPLIMSKLYEHLFGQSRGSGVNLRSASVSNFEPPVQLLTRREQRRRHGQVRTIAATGRRLDRDVPVPV